MSTISTTVDQVRTEAHAKAREANPRKALLTLLLLPFMVLGWLVAKIVVVVVFLASFVAASWKVGYRRGRGVT